MVMAIEHENAVQYNICSCIFLHAHLRLMDASGEIC